MDKFHQTDCVEILSQIKHQEKLLNLKRRWLMGLSTSRSKKKQFKEPEFFKCKTLPESFLRENDMFYEIIKAHVQDAFGASNSRRGNHVIQDDVQSFDASKITGVLFSYLDALTNDGLHLIVMILSGGSGMIKKTQCEMKKAIRESLPSFLSNKNLEHEQKTSIMQLYKILNDPKNFRNNTMKPMTPTSLFHHAAAIQMLDRLEDLPFQTLIAMDRKLSCVKTVPQLKTHERGQKRKRLVQKVGKTARRMLMDLDEEGKLQGPLAKALAVAELSLNLTMGCQNSSTTSFRQFTPEIVSLQNDIVKAIWTLKTKARFPELKALQLLLDPNIEIATRSLRGAIIDALTEFLFECSDMNTIPKSFLEALSVINRDSRSLPNKISRSLPHQSFLKDEIEEEVECILSVSAEMKQIFWDLLPDHELDEEFADAYGEGLEGSDDDSCIEDSGCYENDWKMVNKDLESCMSHSVKSIERDEVIQDVKMDPEYASSNAKSSEDKNRVKNKAPFSSPRGELNRRSIERDEVEQKIGVDPENASNERFADNKTSKCRNRYLAIQEACDETSLVAHKLIGRLLEKFAKEQDMDLDWSDSLYLGGDSSTQQHIQGQEKKQKLTEEDMGDNLIGTLKELMPFVTKSLPGHQNRKS